jgi:hypothetical protein
MSIPLVPETGIEIHNSLIFYPYVKDSIMQPLYTREDFKASKSRQLLPIRCLRCGKTAYRTKHYIQSSLNPRHNRPGDFCSLLCFNIYTNPPIVVQCLQCQTSFKKWASQIKRSTRHFCSSSCAAKWNNAHKTKGTRVSKLEVWLSKKLPELYPAIEFHFNRKDAINGELDIFVPSLKLAFELNGIFHYEPIYGPEKLASIQTNDTRKTQACFERNIELCIIDTSTFKKFKEQRAMRFLTIIQNIINSKLSGSSPVVSGCLASTT